MTDRLTQHLVHGNGPFLNDRNSDVSETVDANFNRVVELEREVQRLNEALAARPTTFSGTGALTQVIERGIPVDEVEVDSIDDNGDGTISIVVSGVALDDFGDFIAPVREYEVSGSVTFPVTFIVKATSETEAEDKGNEVFGDLIGSNDVESYHNEAEDFYSDRANYEVDYIQGK